MASSEQGLQHAVSLVSIVGEEVNRVIADRNEATQAGPTDNTNVAVADAAVAAALPAAPAHSVGGITHTNICGDQAVHEAVEGHSRLDRTVLDPVASIAMPQLEGQCSVPRISTTGYADVAPDEVTQEHGGEHDVQIPAIQSAAAKPGGGPSCTTPPKHRLHRGSNNQDGVPEIAHEQHAGELARQQQTRYHRRPDTPCQSHSNTPAVAFAHCSGFVGENQHGDESDSLSDSVDQASHASTPRNADDAQQAQPGVTRSGRKRAAATSGRGATRGAKQARRSSPKTRPATRRDTAQAGSAAGMAGGVCEVDTEQEPTQIAPAQADVANTAEQNSPHVGQDRDATNASGFGQPPLPGAVDDDANGDVASSIAGFRGQVITRDQQNASVHLTAAATQCNSVGVAVSS